MRTVLRALVGLAIIQFALPKLLPLPGVSESWLLFFLGGSVPGIIAVLLGGVLLTAWGVGWLPSGFTPSQLGSLSALAAVLSRLVGLAGAALLGVPIRWWPDENPGTGAVLGLAVVALLYGTLAYGIARMMLLTRTSARNTTVGPQRS